ncbi:MAG TPA: response regulator [Terriglobales bacterium]|nr:response regulator [Terriglobales bacterium]
MLNPSKSRLSAGGIACAYAVVAALWILFSDLTFEYLGLPPVFQTFKGVGFVLVTASLLFLMIDRLIRQVKHLERELRHSQKLEALGSFAGGITHDFNNLLSIITGYASILEKGAPARSAEAKAAREILNASSRGSLLVQQLLAFSRKQTVITETVDACERVSKFGEVLPRLVGEHIDVQLQCDPQAGAVRVGAGQLEQILMNLAANARDAMKAGGALLVRTSAVEVEESVAALQSVQPGMYVLLEVSDSGTGMTPETRRRLFEPFFTTKPAGTGTGLGLSTVYGIVVQNDGFITCDTTLGKGTSFRVYLPQRECGTDAGEYPVNSPTELCGSETVLLVEDEPALRTLTEHILRTHGYGVLTATNAREALDLARANGQQIDVLLTDIVMPGMNGVDLAREIEQLAPKARIILMSGYSDVALPVNGKAHLIQKPVAPDSLLLQLRNVLDESGAS